MTVNDSEMSEMKKTSLVNTGDIRLGDYRAYNSCVATR